MKIGRAGLLITGLAAALTVQAAEIRGVVQLQQMGLFRLAGQVQDNLPIGVALWPGRDMAAVPRPAPNHYQIRVQHGHLSPAYLLIRPGDTVDFINADGLIHRLFAMVPGDQTEMNIKLGKQTGETVHSVTFDKTGVHHLFCRIHGRSYARIDVVDAPRLAMIKAGEPFEFRKLDAGVWRMRLAAPGAATVTMDAVAMTAPPPLKLWLPVKSGVQPNPSGGAADTVGVEQLYPAIRAKE